MHDDDAKRETLLPDTYPHKQTHIHVYDVRSLQTK